MTINRRHFLVGAAVLTLVPGRAFAAAVNDSEILLALLPDRQTAARLGETWIRQDQPRPDVVLQSLKQRLNGGDADKLRNAIAEDFRNGAVVQVEGWRIARTQAELCALAYFSKIGSL